MLELKLTENQIQSLTQLQKQLTEELEQTFAARPKTVADLKAALSEALSAQTDFAAIEQSSKTQTTTLTLVHPLVEIRNLPWQLAVEHLPLLYLTKAHTAALPQAPPQYGYPLNILVMVSAPEGAKGLDFEHEEAQLLKAFNPLMEDGLVQVHFTDDGSLEDLDRKLQDNHYHILHFSGHGSYEKGIGYLILEDQVSGRVQKVTAEDFNAVLAKASDLRHRPELVVLSACQTAQAQISGETGGVADTLLNGGQAAVVAMSASILDNCATYFAATFYRRLAEGLPLPRAFKEATTELRNYEVQYQNISISQYQNNTPSQWLIPQLLMGNDLQFIADKDKTQVKLNFKEDAKYVTGEKDLLRLRVRTKDYVFIGRRKDKRAVFHQLLEGKAILLRGQGGVGKTAFAEHLAIRLMAYSQRYKPFVLSNFKVNDYKNEVKTDKKEELDLPLISELRHYLIALNQFDILVYNEQKSIEEKLSFLLKAIQVHCKPVFIFDNIESFQNIQTGEWDKDQYEHILNILDYLQKHSKSPILITGRYPIQELPDISLYDLNTVTLTDFWKKCQQLNMRHLMYSSEVFQRNLVVQVEVSIGFMEVVRQLHHAFGGNYRALEFFDELYVQKGKEAVLGTLKNFDNLKATLKNSTAEVRHKMSLDLVFSQLLELLTPYELDALQVLAHFNIPVLPKAVEMQRVGNNYDVALNQLADLTFVERSSFNDYVWFYVMPLVKSIMIDKNLYSIMFHDRLAGDYHVDIDNNINKSDNKDIIESFNFYKSAKYDEGLNNVGTILSKNYYFVQQFRLSLIYGLQTYEICKEKTNSEVWTCLGLIYKLYGDLDKAHYFYEMALAKCRNENDTEGEGINLNNIGQVYDEKGDWDTALQYIEQGLSIARRIKDRENESRCLTNLGKITFSQGNYDKALQYFENSLKISKQDNNIISEGVTLNNIGYLYTVIGKLDEAIEHFEKGLAIKNKAGDYQGEAIILNNISLIHIQKGDFTKGLKCLERALLLQQQTGDRKAEGVTLNNIGRIYSAFEDYKSSLLYFDKSLKIRQEIGDRHGEGMTLNNIGHAYLTIGQDNNALHYFEHALRVQEQIDDIAGMCPTLHNLSNIYLTKKNNVEKWYEYANKAYQLSIEIGNAEWIYRVGQDFGFFLCQIGKKEQGIPILKFAIETGRKVGFNDIDLVEAAVRELL